MGRGLKLHSRADWEAQDLFQPILEQASRFCDDSVLVVAMDDTRIRKTGRKILSAFFQRDPLSPKFRFNLMWGDCASCIFLCWCPCTAPRRKPRRGRCPCVLWKSPAIKRPGKKASAAEWETYQQAVEQGNLSRRAIDLLKELRQSTDDAELGSRTILAVGDGGFCNRTLFRQPLDRIQLLARARRDCRLCFAAEPGGRRFYSTEVFTPDEIRQRESVPWQSARIFHGGQWREVRYRRGLGIRALSAASGRSSVRGSPHPLCTGERPAQILSGPCLSLDHRSPSFLLRFVIPTVSMTNSPNHIEVVTSVQRRRRWTASEKVRMVEETFEP